MGNYKILKNGDFGPKILLPLLALLFVSMLLIGCVNQKQDLPTPPKSGEIPKSPDKSIPSVPANITKNDSMVSENKTGVEKVEQAIASVVPDGTYTDNVTYAYHSGKETIEISITVKDDIITEASIHGFNPQPFSAKMISGVNSALPDLVVGKKITELNIPHQVSGSSLTTAAFKNYVDGLVKK